MELQTYETSPAIAPEKRRGRPSSDITKCTICGKKTIARGWCMRHYRQWKRTGNPIGRVKKILSCKLCSEPRGEKTAGYCAKHYNIWLEHKKSKKSLIKTLQLQALRS